MTETKTSQREMTDKAGAMLLAAANKPRLPIAAETLNRGVARYKAGRAGLPRDFANVSRNHPDYGLTVAEHEQMKWARAQGWAQPQSIEDVTARLKAIAETTEETSPYLVGEHGPEEHMPSASGAIIPALGGRGE